MRRVLGLYLPFLPTDRLCAPRSVPVATIAPVGQTMRLVHANHMACDQGVRPGQTLAHAKAILPDLITHEDDPAADRRRLEALAIWAGCLSPIVHIDPTGEALPGRAADHDHTLLVDVTGCERLFNGEPNLLRQAVDGLQAQGFDVRAAIADTPGAAWALCHAHPEPAVIAPPGQTAAELICLPVWSLRIEPQTTEALASVGVETVASLLHLPRSSLVTRFGEALLDRIDQALGDLPEVLTPYRPQPALTSRFDLGTATTRLDALTGAIHRALVRFCEQLEKRVAGVRQVFVTFYCPDVAVETGTETRTVTLHVDLSQPTRSVPHLHALLVVLLDGLSLSAPADSVMLWARRLDPLDGWQDELFATGSSDARELGDLLDRLAVRIGPEAVARPRLLSDHQPERAFRYVSAVGATDAASYGAAACEAEHDTTATGPRPLRLLPHPVEVSTTSLVPEGPPLVFRHHGQKHTVARSVGPERIETGWWRGPHIRRDYYRATTEAGRRVWLFRDRGTERWFLHGWFD